MSHDSTIPSPLGPVDTVPSQLGPAQGMPRQPRRARSGRWTTTLLLAFVAALAIYGLMNAIFG